MLPLNVPRGNHLLSVLPEAEWSRLAAQLVPVDLPLGRAIYESGDRLDYAFFPTTAIVSLLYVMENGSSAEIAIVGNEGVVGIAIFMGGETMPSRAIVQSAGAGYTLDRAAMKAEFNRGVPMQRLLLRYTQALITQMVQTAVDVLDRRGLEARVCECYTVVKQEFDRLLPNLQAI